MGRPLAASVTLEEKPPTSVTVMVLVALLPWLTVTEDGEGESVKPGSVIEYVAEATELEE